VAVVLLPRYPFTPWPIVNLGITIFWLTATTNAFNLIDGLDGLASGVAVVAGAAIAIAAFVLGAPEAVALSLIVCASLLGFLVYNFPPASIIMGDAGALPLGYVLGVLALEGGRCATNSRLAMWAFPALVMLVPLLDTGIVTVARTATGQAISRHGLDHAHDRLIALGLTDRQVAVATWLVALIGAVGAVGITSLSAGDLVVALPLIALIAVVIALFTIDMTFDDTMPVTAYGALQGMARLLLSLGYKRRAADGAMDLILIVAAYCSAVALRLDFKLTPHDLDTIVGGLPWVIALTYPAFLVTGVYRGIWRHVGLADGIRLVTGAMLAGLLTAMGSAFLPFHYSGSIAVMYAVLLGNFLVATRTSFILLRKFINRLVAVADRVLVIGAGSGGAMAADYLFQTRPRSARLVGFVDADNFRLGKLVEGWRVLGTPEEIEHIYGRIPFTEILIADEHLAPAHLEQICRFGRERGLRVRSFTMQVNDMDAGRAADSPLVRGAAAAIPL
jgi:UDP-GlcNAc:undecaprenyl-phosphate GlcNAc-1-phosphate transferase